MTPPRVDAAVLPRGARIVPYGDAAALILLGDGVDDELCRRAQQVAAAIRGLAADDARFGAPVPAAASVLVPLDPAGDGVEASTDALARAVAAVLAAPLPEPPAARLVELPTRYGGVHGPDLDGVAALHGLRPADVVELHAAHEYHVQFLGFAPGFAYLGTLPSVLATPRLDTPRERVPAGSVAMAGRQTAVYPLASPGGWRLIGRTEVRVWQPDRDPPALLAPGDRVRFVPVTG